VRVVREGVLLYEGPAENLLAILRKQDGLGSQIARADRLRCYGNGVVPLQAAVAFSVLLDPFMGED